MTTTLELIEYYGDLLINQYNGKPNATGTIETFATPIVMPQTSLQTITFSSEPTSGAFTLSYDDVVSTSISYSANAAAVQTALRTITALASVTVTGSISAGLTVTFTGVYPPALLLVEETNTLSDGSAVSITIEETDLTIPLAVLNGYNLVGTDIAQGTQLDVLGQYAGVSRTGQGFSTTITLSDADFLSLIRIAIIQNSAGSSLYDIQNLLFQFFPLQIRVVDNTDMTLVYYVSTEVGSSDLIQLFIAENLLPKPMAVDITLIVYGPTVNDYFGYRTYTLAAPNSTPFNSYTSYNTSWVWLSYADTI